MANGSNGAQPAQAQPQAGQAQAQTVQGQDKIVTLGGAPVHFPSSWSWQQVQEAIQKGTYDNLINNPDHFKQGMPPTPDSTMPAIVPPGATPQVGEIPKGAVQPSVATIAPPAPPGAEREFGIGVTQLARGLADPAALPGDVIQGARAIGVPVPQLLPTSADVDREFGPNRLGIMSPAYAPGGFWENQLAATTRGLGGAMTGTVLSDIPATGRWAFNAPRAATGTYGPTGREIAQNLVAGPVGGFVGETTAQMPWAQDAGPVSRIAPIVMGGLAGGAASGGVAGAQSRFGGSAYDNTLNRLGVDMTLNTPHLEDAGSDIRTQLMMNNTLAKRRGDPPGLGGVQGTDLTTQQFKTLTNKNTSDRQIATTVLQGPKISPILSNEMPNHMEGLGAAAIANNQWPKHGTIQRSLLTNPIERTAVTAGPSGSGLENMLSSLREGWITRGVMSDAMSRMADYATALASHDPQLHALVGLAGSAAPFVGPVVRGMMASAPIRRGAVFGGMAGTDPSMYLNAPNAFAPPSQGGPVGQRTDQSQ